MKDSGRVIGALLLGAAAGAALGLLFAPGKGTEMRKKIMETGDDLISELTDRLNESKKSLTDLKDRIMNKADEVEDELAVNTATGDHQMQGYGSKYKNNTGSDLN